MCVLVPTNHAGREPESRRIAPGRIPIKMDEIGRNTHGRNEGIVDSFDVRERAALVGAGHLLFFVILGDFWTYYGRKIDVNDEARAEDRASMTKRR